MTPSHRLSLINIMEGISTPRLRTYIRVISCPIRRQLALDVINSRQEVSRLTGGNRLDTRQPAPE